MKTIWVVAKPNLGRVALWERNKEHPDGEVFVTGDTPVEVAQTPAVRRQLASGMIVEVEAPAAAGAKPTGEIPRSKKNPKAAPADAEAPEDADAESTGEIPQSKGGKK